MLYLWCNKSPHSVDEWVINFGKIHVRLDIFRGRNDKKNVLLNGGGLRFYERINTNWKYKKDQAKCNFCGSFWTDALRKLNKTVKILQVKGQCNGKLTVPFSEHVWLWSGLIRFVAPEDAARGLLLVEPAQVWMKCGFEGNGLKTKWSTT